MPSLAVSFVTVSILLLQESSICRCQCDYQEQAVCAFEDSVQVIKDDIPGEVLAQIRIKHVKSLKKENCDNKDYLFKYDKKPGSPFLRSPVNDLFASPVLSLTINDPDSFGSAQRACLGGKECDKVTKETLQQQADVFVKKNKAPGSTGNMEIDRKLAYGITLVQFGFLDDAIHLFSEILKSNSKVAGAYYGRGVAYARKNLKLLGDSALEDFANAIKYEPKVREIYERRAEVYIAMGRYTTALKDIATAKGIKTTSNQYFLNGHVEFVSGDLHMAEKKFRRSLILDDDNPSIMTMFHLAMTLYLRGKMRNAAELYKDILKLDNTAPDVYASVSEAYREIGDTDTALQYLNKSLSIDAEHLLSLQVLASIYYQKGDMSSALRASKRCLDVSHSSSICQYIESMALTAQGNLYEGVKSATKVIIYHRPATMVKASSEFVKAHYIKEYARYLHTKLDQPINDLNLERDFTQQYRLYWAKSVPFTIKGYVEQPGIQPHISDVNIPNPEAFSAAERELICKAAKVGSLTKPQADGYMENSRYNIAMGLAAIHIAQTAEDMWNDQSGGKKKVSDWMDLMNTSIFYRRLVFPEQVLLWMDQLPLDDDMKLPDTHFIRGQTINVPMSSYFEVVFKLAKTMILHYYGGKDKNEKQLLSDLERAENPEDVLDMARRHDLSQNGFVVSTEVPSIKSPSALKLDGPVLALTAEGRGKALFTINCMASRGRSDKYKEEILHIFHYIRNLVQEGGLKKTSDSDGLLTMVVTMAYYMYNWIPLSKGSSVVTYTMTLGMIMSLGKEVTTKMPQGKLLDIEAMLAGAPDIYTAVFKQWVTIKKIQKPVSSLPRVASLFPTVRSVVEVLNMGSAWCP